MLTRAVVDIMMMALPWTCKVRKGAAGKSFEDGMTTEIQKKIHDLVEQSVSDPEARKWMFKGGPIAEPEPGHGEL